MTIKFATLNGKYVGRGVMLFDMHGELYFFERPKGLLMLLILWYVCPAVIKLPCYKTTRNCFCVNLYMIEY